MEENLKGITSMETSTPQHTKHVSVPSHEGLRVDKAITIERPVTEVYAFWSHLENLPRFMRGLESVRVQDNLHSHWVAKPLGGKALHWDAEIIEQRQNEMISWRSTPGADLDNAGSVWFTTVPGGQGTLVRVEWKYIPPAGKAGALLAKTVGRDGGQELEQDLYRLKMLLETGRVPEAPRSAVWQRATKTARKVSKAGTDYIQQKPWIALGSIALAGLVIGFLAGRYLRSTPPRPD